MPLAVMKLENEVTLQRKREVEAYEEILKLTVKQILQNLVQNY